MAKKKEKFPYKFLRPEELDELRTMTTEELLKEYLTQTRAAQIVQKQKKDDASLTSLKKEIKTHRDSSRRLKDAKEKLKEIREDVDSEIMDEIEDKKALEGGYNDQIKGHKEKAHAIQKIIEGRNKQ